MQTNDAATDHGTVADLVQDPDSPVTSRVTAQKLTTRLFQRPEVSSLIGLIGSFVVFALIAGDSGFLTSAGQATVWNVAAQFGIVAVPVTMLLICGEFDLSIGSVIGFAGLFYAISIANWGWPLWISVIATIAVSGALGALNGYLVVRTGVPSFIITLCAFFSVRGLALGLANSSAGTPFLGGLGDYTDGTWVQTIFSGRIYGNFRASILWWIGISIVCWRIMTRTRFGNWLAGVGGSNLAARQLGVPIKRVKVIMFAVTSATAGLLAVIQVTEVGGADALRGTGKEFEAVTAAVIGGTLLFGGYGTVIGTFLGALTLAMLRQGLFFYGVDNSWYQFILGIVLLVAVLANFSVLKRASGGARK